MGLYAGRKRRGMKGYHQDPFEKVVCYVPKRLTRQLRVLEDTYGVKVERLLVRAALNANVDQFSFDLNISDYTVDVVTKQDEAKLFKWLAKSKVGIDLDLVLMVYDDIGFNDDRTLRATIKMMLAKGMICLINDEHTAIPQLKVAFDVRTRGKPTKFKLFAGSDTNGNKT